MGLKSPIFSIEAPIGFLNSNRGIHILFEGVFYVKIYH